jgi:hypothetical protein
MTGTANPGGSCGNHTSKYVRSAQANESIMCEMINGYKLIKGKNYKFRILVRVAEGDYGSFQLVFSTKKGSFFRFLDCNRINQKSHAQIHAM